MDYSELTTVVTSNLLSAIAQVGVLLVVCLALSIMLASLLSFFKASTSHFAEMGDDSNFLTGKLSNCLGFMFVILSIFSAAIIAWVYMYK